VGVLTRIPLAFAPRGRKRMKRIAIILTLCLAQFSATPLSARQVHGPSRIEHRLEIVLPGETTTARLDLVDALNVLHVPSVTIALIDRGTLSWARAWGDASTRTLYQAASLSKLVSAVAALRLVEQGRLDLDRDVDDDLTGWRVSDSDLSRGHPVTLRGLLSMTAGIGVPGYLGYEPGAPLPDLTQILDGAPPANSSPVRVAYTPGSRYFYSGGGYEIVQRLIEIKTNGSFDAALRDLVFRRAGMANSVFEQPLSVAVSSRAARGHYDDGRELPGGWRVLPELAAGGLWSTPSDLAKLLIEIARAYRGERNPLLGRKVAIDMLTPQNGGPYGLGGAVGGSGRSLVLMKRGQNIGYQAYMLIFPRTGQGMVVMTGSDNGTRLATALIRRAAILYGWPPLGELAD
jgi:CubicO group peptidase (beta-lactamase class C family)